MREIMRDTQGCRLEVGDIVWPRYHDIQNQQAAINQVEARIIAIEEQTEAGIRVRCKVTWVPRHVAGIGKNHEFVTYDTNLLKLDTSWTEEDIQAAVEAPVDKVIEHEDRWSIDELEEIMFEGFYDHPELGRIEPDHPESPLYKLGLI